MKKKYRIGFKSKTQLPFFMFWCEEWENNEVINGYVIYQTRF